MKPKKLSGPATSAASVGLSAILCFFNDFTRCRTFLARRKPIIASSGSSDGSHLPLGARTWSAASVREKAPFIRPGPAECNRWLWRIALRRPPITALLTILPIRTSQKPLSGVRDAARVPSASAESLRLCHPRARSTEVRVRSQLVQFDAHNDTGEARREKPPIRTLIRSRVRWRKSVFERV